MNMKKIDISGVRLLAIFILLCVLIVESELQAKANDADISKYQNLSMHHFSCIQDSVAQQDSLKYIIDFHIECGHFPEAEKLAKKIVLAEDKVDIYCNIATQLHFNHENVEAKKYLDLAQQTSRASIPSTEDISNKLRGYLARDKIEEDREVVKQAHLWAFSGNSRANYLIAKTQAAMGDIQGALDVIACMKKYPCEDQWDDLAVISVVSEQVTKVGLSDALKTAKTISANNLRDKAYLRIIKQLISIKQIEKIEQVQRER